MSEHLEQIWQYWQAGGYLMPILAFISFLILSFYFYLWYNLNRALSNSQKCMDELEKKLTVNKDDQSIYHWLSTMPGAIPRLIRHLLLRCWNGLNFRDGFSQCRQAELKDYSSGFIFLGALVAVAPLLGLLGTVLGMVETFDAVAMNTAGTDDMVAKGLSKALITTQVGLLIALPGSFGLAHLYKLYKQLSNHIDRVESSLSIYFMEQS